MSNLEKNCNVEELSGNGYVSTALDANIQMKSTIDPQAAYFWKEAERVIFIKALHQHGKSWKLISNNFEQRDKYQCRSHGQKYLKSLKVLQEISQRAIEGESMPSDKDHIKIKSYDQVLKSLKSQKESLQDYQLNSQFFPRYLYNLIIDDQEPQLMQCTDKMNQINKAISNELNYYDKVRNHFIFTQSQCQYKEEKKIKNQQKKTAKNPYSQTQLANQTFSIENIVKVEDLDQVLSRRQKN
ncbi:UNKNOWN [Stylonychia lemnae]|uniref:Uncharacterized protein n=1 Tax=Stylonychia lemnae TaxID=5949 RepID=A0A078BEC7_STYLE|nr:UNKNOWN [Stylonychia lemnae]|eukprot:CDW91497.1 UNKNOWN [Stylonychia lemnae]